MPIERLTEVVSMSTAGIAALTQAKVSDRGVSIEPTLSRKVAATSVLRKGNMEQGKALETLGHALEYLQDSRMFLIDEPTSDADIAAVQILAGLSRAVFAECVEVRPFSRRWRDWVIGRPSAVAAHVR
jgi:hypothetical protein